MSREKLSPIRLEGYQPLRDMVFDVLMNAIMQGQLSPGERLLEVQLADEMGVSRTPVREAIRRLELEGFVVMWLGFPLMMWNLFMKYAPHWKLWR